VSAALATAVPGSRRRRLQVSQEWLLLLGIVALVIVVGLVNPRFVAMRNMQTILLGNAYIAVAAIGMSMVIISGNIDISIGSLIGVLATVSGSLAVAGVPVGLAWLIPILLSVVVMMIQGAFVAYLNIPAIVVTLGMMSILKGGLISVTSGAWISNLPVNFHLAQDRVFGVVPMPVFLMVVLTLAAAWWMRNTSAGRSIYAVGGNVEAARLCGYHRRRTLMMIFAVHGLFAGVAAVLFATQLSVIQSTVPANLELTIITASVVGGVSILGGTGTVIGSTLAAVLIATIANSLVFVNISPFWIRAVQGTLILITILADMLRRRRRMQAR
jgi:ribose transport system permease protein/rhamnose transport system permease protein